MNQVPALIKHPFSSEVLDSMTFKNPDPENVPVAVEVGAVDVDVLVPVAVVAVEVFLVAVVVATGVPVLVLYETPLAGQSDVSPAIWLRGQYSPKTRIHLLSGFGLREI